MGGFELPKRRAVPPSTGLVGGEVAPPVSAAPRRRVPPKAAPLPVFSDDEDTPIPTITTTATTLTTNTSMTSSTVSSTRPPRRRPICNPLPPEALTDDPPEDLPTLPLAAVAAALSVSTAACPTHIKDVSVPGITHHHPLPIFSWESNSGDGSQPWVLRFETPTPSKQHPKHSKKKRRNDVDCFPTDGSHITVANPVSAMTEVEVDVFKDNWQCFDSMRPQFKVSSNGAEQTSFLILNDSRRSEGHSPQPVYAGVWGADDSDDDEPGIQYEDVQMTSELIGRGAQGSVLKCYHKKTHRPLALKRIDLNTFKKDQLLIEAQGKVISRELSMLFAHHESQHIVKAYNAFYRSNCLLLLFEYMDWSLEHIRDTVLRIPPEKIAGITARTFTKQAKKIRRRHAEDKKCEKQPLNAHQYMPISSGKAASTQSNGSRMTSTASLEDCLDAGSSNGGSPRTPGSTRKKKKGPPRGTPFPEKVIVVIGYQILQGLMDLHKLKYAGLEGVVHKDIKPGNILINANGKVKIADFGCCSFVDSTGNVPNTPFNVGTQAYMAPERHHPGEYCSSADIWAMGITLLELANGCHPLPVKDTMTWHAFSQDDVCFNESVKLVWPPEEYGMTAAFKEFLEACLRIDPGERPSAKELLDFEVFQQQEIDYLKLSNWAQRVMEHEKYEKNRESRLEAKKQSKHLTEHVASKVSHASMISSFMTWRQFSHKQHGGGSSSNTMHDPDDLEAFPPLGINCRKEYLENFPRPSSECK
eukprot:TRINITY_DN6858_c0_g1_i1.p1 TRINITY_DN6858_c0_g1~~TRINITY_DN6858_c0_g1_i1.p1  ORF type:complete len:765 (+),score=108.95 TRINITY_DN6858_c0_g1_i1:31-2295(+)